MRYKVNEGEWNEDRIRERVEGQQVEKADRHSAVRHDVIRRFVKPVRAQAATVVTTAAVPQHDTGKLPASHWPQITTSHNVIVTQTFGRWTKRPFLLRWHGSHVGEASESEPSLSWIERSGSDCGHYRLCRRDFRYGELLSALH